MSRNVVSNLVTKIGSMIEVLTPDIQRQPTRFKQSTKLLAIKCSEKNMIDLGPTPIQIKSYNINKTLCNKSNPH